MAGAEWADANFLSGEEIAELTGVKLGTVWVTLHRARERFLKRLEAMTGVVSAKAAGGGRIAPAMAERSQP